MNPSVLDFDDAPETKVYQAVIRALKGYSVLANKVPDANWVTWLGEDNPDADLPNSDSVLVRLLPVWGRSNETRGLFTSADSVVLEIGVEVIIPGLNVVDLLNFWAAVRDAFNRPGKPNEAIEIENDLRAAGAEPACPKFVSPTPIQSEKTGRWHALGSIVLTVRYTLV